MNGFTCNVMYTAVKTIPNNYFYINKPFHEHAPLLATFHFDALKLCPPLCCFRKLKNAPCGHDATTT